MWEMVVEGWRYSIGGRSEDDWQPLQVIVDT